MAERLCAGLLDRGTEFVVAYDPVSGNTSRRFGTCGPRALASAVGNVRNRAVLCADVYTLMRQHGLCDPSGASTIGDLQEAAILLGSPIAAYQGYGEPWPQWAAFLNAHAGYDPMVIEVADGQAFVDTISGDGENAVNLQYHFVCVLGRNDGGYSPHAGRNLPPGYWVADGDNFAGGNSNSNGFNAANTLQYYPDSVMAAARVCAALALPGLAQGVQMGVPTGWHDDGVTLTAPNGHRVVRGFRDYILTGAGGSGWNPSDQPLEEEHTVTPYVEHHNHALGPGVRQLFLRTILRWNTPAEGVKESDAGAELQACEAELAAADQQVATLTGDVASLNTQLGDANASLKAADAQIAALTAQVAQLTAQIQQGNPLATEALSTVEALKALFAKLP